MNTVIGDKKFSIINKNSNLSCIVTHNEKDYLEALSVLNTMKCKTITRTMDHLKPINMIVKGIHSSFLETEVQTELKQSTSCCILKAYKFTTIKSKRESKDLNMYFIQFANTTKIQDITKIKYLFGQQLSWEIFKRTDIVQCHRCQRLGHISSNCTMPFRCVKCNESHLPGECNRDVYEQETNENGETTYIRDENGNLKRSVDENGIAIRKMDKNGKAFQPYCVCCKKEGHPANFRGCEAYQLIINNRRKENNNASWHNNNSTKMPNKRSNNVCKTSSILE